MLGQERYAQWFGSLDLESESVGVHEHARCCVEARRCAAVDAEELVALLQLLAAARHHRDVAMFLGEVHAEPRARWFLHVHEHCLFFIHVYILSYRVPLSTFEH